MDYGIKARTHSISGLVTVTTPDTLQDVWGGAELINLNLAAGGLEIVSDDAEDTAAGDGAQCLLLRGNSNAQKPKYQTEEIDLNGTSTVTSALAYQGMGLAQARVIRSNNHLRRDVPLGTITITQSGQVVGMIAQKNVQTYHCFRRVPFTSTGAVEHWNVNGGYVTLVSKGSPPTVHADLGLWRFPSDSQSHFDGAASMEAGRIAPSIRLGEPPGTTPGDPPVNSRWHALTTEEDVPGRCSAPTSRTQGSTGW